MLLTQGVGVPRGERPAASRAPDPHPVRGRGGQLVLRKVWLRLEYMLLKLVMYTFIYVLFIHLNEHAYTHLLISLHIEGCKGLSLSHMYGFIYLRHIDICMYIYIYLLCNLSYIYICFSPDGECIPSKSSDQGVEEDKQYYNHK